MTALTDKEITNLDSHVEYFLLLIDFEVHICFADNSMRLVSYHQSRWWGLQALIYWNCYNTMQIKIRWALFVTYTIIQSIMSSEMCSLHLTHPSAHTWCSGQPTLQLGVRCLAQGSHLSRGHFQPEPGHFLPEPGFEPTTLGYLGFQVQRSIH